MKLNKIILLKGLVVFLIINSFWACQKEAPSEPYLYLPLASFTMDTDRGTSIYPNVDIIAGERVEFNNGSQNSSSRKWIFDGGTPATSIVENPEIKYNTAGFYDVILIAINSDGPDTLVCKNCVEVQSSNTQDLLTAGIGMRRILKLKPLDSLYGKYYNGGLIYYVDSIAARGLVAAKTDQSTGTSWCGSSNSNISTGTTVWQSTSNTNSIESNCSSLGSAADICANLNLAGYTDWTLPSYYSLFYMHQNLKEKGFGGFTNRKYWTSSASSLSYAKYIDFTTGNNGTNSKQGQFRVRACREF